MDCVTLGASLLKAYMPETAEKIFAQLNTQAREWDDLDKTGLYPSGNKVTDKPEILFARLDVDEVMDKVTAMEEAAKPQPEIEVEPQLTEQVDFDTFCKCDFRAVKVKACEAVKKSQKLLRFTLDDGTGRGPADPLRHSQVVRAGGPDRQDPGGHCEPAPPEDDGPGELRDAALRGAHGKGRGVPAPDDGGRQYPRRGQAVLSGVPPLSIRARGSWSPVGPPRTDRAGRRDRRLNAAPVRAVGARPRRRQVKVSSRVFAEEGLRVSGRAVKGCACGSRLTSFLR